MKMYGESNIPNALDLTEEIGRLCRGESKKTDVRGERGGREIRVRALPKKQGLVVSVGCARAGRFRVTRQNGLDRWMADFVPAWRFRSYDVRFDREFNVRTRDLEVTSSTLANPIGRAAVRKLFELGIHMLTLETDRLDVMIASKQLGDESESKVFAILTDLGSIADAVDRFAKRHEVHPSQKMDAGLAFTSIGLTLIGLLGGGLLMAGTIEYPLVRPASILLLCAAIGFPSILPAVCAVALGLQHRTAPYSLVRGFALLAFFVVPLFTSGTIVFLNGICDSSPGQEHVVTVLGKTVRENKNGVRYQAALESWWSEGDVRWVDVSKSLFDQLEPNVTRMRATTHPGWLGYEWLDDYRPIPTVPPLFR
ncbi:MAG: hypothetical protein RL885_29615 [Planctomycetota bacterium]